MPGSLFTQVPQAGGITAALRLVCELAGVPTNELSPQLQGEPVDSRDTAMKGPEAHPGLPYRLGQPTIAW
jgi:hypothetical protein